MSVNDENQEIKEKIKELQEFVSNSRDVREWKRGEAAKLRVLGVSYQEIQKRLGVSISFIAKSHKKYIERGIAGLKLGYQGSKSYFYNQPMSEHLKRPCIRNNWLKLLTMYSYSMPFELIDDFPAEIAIPALRDYVFVNWVRIKGGVYSYVEKILERFKGEILLNVEIANIFRSPDGVKIVRSHGEIQEFDKVVFATPPDQVMKLLSDPTDAETKRFSAWRANYATTLLHTDTSMYTRYGIQHSSEFDFFQTHSSWGYNAYLNRLCGISSPRHYSLAFQLDELIAKDQIIHIQEHHTPFYTVESFRYRDEVVATNGENNTYHAGAYLGDGLHEGAIASAVRVAQLIG